MSRPLLKRFSINLKDGKELFIVDNNYEINDEQLCKQHDINYDDVLTIKLLSVS